MATSFRTKERGREKKEKKVERFGKEYDRKQGNNNTRALSTKIVFFGCRKIDNTRRRK